MKKIRKNVLKYLWIFLIISSCKTIIYIYPDYQLPPEPTLKDNSKENEKKLMILDDENEKIYREIILDYNELLRKWLEWANDVKKIIKKPEEK